MFTKEKIIQRVAELMQNLSLEDAECVYIFVAEYIRKKGLNRG